MLPCRYVWVATTTCLHMMCSNNVHSRHDYFCTSSWLLFALGFLLGCKAIVYPCACMVCCVSCTVYTADEQQALQQVIDSGICTRLVHLHLPCTLATSCLSAGIGW
jgi:hypothetical protein